MCHVTLDLWQILHFSISFSGNWAFLPPVKPLAWHAHAGRLLTASCFWLCHRITDSLEFSNSDQALSSGGSHLVMQAPESEVLPGQVSSRLFGGLKAGEVRCVTCICTCMQRAQLLLLPVVCPEAPVLPPHSSISASKLFPKAACQWCILPNPWEEQCGCVCVCWS